MEYIDSQTNPTTTEAPQANDVADALTAYTADDKGKVVIPDGTPAHIVTALKVEQQKRNANSSYSKERARADKLEAENAALKESMATLARPEGLSAEQVNELEELKFSDPDAWFAKKTAMENINTQQVQTRVNEVVTQASETAERNYATQQAAGRETSLNELMNSHNVANPERPITMDMMSLNVPPVLVNQYHSGVLDGPTFLDRVSKFLYANQVVDQTTVPTEPNLGDATGSSTPSTKAETKSLEQVYAGI